jgi:hypothetical protein
MLDKIFKSKIFIALYTPLLFLLACRVTLTNQEIVGTVVFLYITAAMLLLSSRITDAMLPALLLCVFVTRCYNSADAFLAMAPYFVPPVVAVVLHFVLYAKRLRFGIGRSFFGLCGVTLAVTLGGLGTISAGEYFAGGALFYVFGLGLGMVIFYLLVKANSDGDSPRDVLRVVYVMGLFACFCVIRFYVADWEHIWQTMRETRELVEFQSSNNLATLLMLAMPVPLFYASRRYIDILSVFLIYACVFLSGSRGGLLMGTVEFVLIFFAFAIFDKRIFNRILFALIGIGFIVAMYKSIPYIAEFYRIDLGLEDGETATLLDYVEKLKGFFFKEGEARMTLVERMKLDFKSNPVFGVGIGYTGNEDAYNPVKGAMNWYHMWFAQVIGGLGVLGILAYGYQLVDRFIIFFKNRSMVNLTFLLSYLGLLLMSQVNPGEFCPMPYAALAMTYFALMEKDTKSFKDVIGSIRARLTPGAPSEAA